MQRTCLQLSQVVASGTAWYAERKRGTLEGLQRKRLQLAEAAAIVPSVAAWRVQCRHGTF